MLIQELQQSGQTLLQHLGQKLQKYTPLDHSQHGVVHATKNNDIHGQQDACHVPTNIIAAKPKKMQTVVANLIEHGLGHAKFSDAPPTPQRTQIWAQVGKHRKKESGHAP
jgi:hypothetical protein